jgi:hypothetical protein
MNTLFTLIAFGIANPPPAPLSVVTPVADKGDIKAGPPLIHTFDLTHAGGAGTLYITRVEAGCGCLRQSLTSTRLQPGETAKLSIEVNSLTQPDGPNRWQVQVSYTLDLPPAAPGGPVMSRSGTQPLTITANLSREVSVTPPQVAFSCTGEASQTLILTDTRGKPLTVVKAITTSNDLTAQIGQPGNAPNGTRTQAILLKLSADAPIAHRDDTVVLYTDDPAYPELRIPVRILKRAPGGVTATPDAVSLRFAAGQEEVSAIVQLRVPDGKNVAIASAESDTAAVKVKWSPGTGPVATVRVTVATPDAAQAGAGMVRVKFSEPAGQELVIPVSWTGEKK